MKAHDKLRNVAHQIVEPVVDTRQNVDWFVIVPEIQRRRVVGHYVGCVKKKKNYDQAAVFKMNVQKTTEDN